MSVLETWPVLLLVCTGLLGLLVGSFLNVVAFRWPIMFEREWRDSCADFAREHDYEFAPASTPNRTDAAKASAVGDGSEAAAAEPRFDLAWPPSSCTSCGARIAPWHNIPVVSWLMLRGRCASCKAPISIRYPLVEAFTGAASVCVAAILGPTFATAAGLVFTWFLIAMSLIDFDTQFLPDRMTLPLMWIGLLLNVVPTGTAPPFTNLEASVIGAAAGYMSLWSINYLFAVIRGRQGMGGGDFKLLAAIGAWLGWQMLLPVVVLASAVGAVVGVGLIALRNHAPAKPIPFGPYLAGGGWIALLWGHELVGRYLGLMG